MFGCTKTIRNWSAEGKGTSPTHVSLYDTTELSLDREGMVLVALMSGGDYIPAGIPGCGIRVACEAAQGRFGKSLCQLKKVNDSLDGIEEWRASLVHELRTNESGHFRTKHKSLTIPEDFPNFEVLRYYTHPVVSPQATLDAVRKRFKKQSLHLESLREFTVEIFGWDLLKFATTISPCLLIDKMQENPELVKQITGRRAHFSTDATPELRLSFVPGEVAPVDMSEEEVVDEIPSSREGLALNSDDEFDESAQAAAPRIYDPTKPELVWVLEAVARRFIPSSVEAWEAAEAAKAARKVPKAPAKKAVGSKGKAATGKAATGMAAGAIDQFVKVTKKNVSLSKPSATQRLRAPLSPLEPSKQPTPSPTQSPVRQKNPWRLASSQTTPSTRHETIVISSSPPCPVDSAPISPSPRPRRHDFDGGSQELPESLRSILASIDGAQVKSKGRQPSGKTKAAEPAVPSSSQGGRLKQTSMEMFTRKLDRPVSSSSQPSRSSQPPRSSQSSRSSQPEPKPAPKQTTKEKPQPQPRNDWSDSDSDLEDLTTLLAQPPSLSPSKRRKDVFNPPSRSAAASPSPAPARKKKLFVPRAGTAGLVDEIEVEADEYEERFAKESAALRRRGGRGAVARMSDVVFVDLTGED